MKARPAKADVTGPPDRNLPISVIEMGEIATGIAGETGIPVCNMIWPGMFPGTTQ
jgi:hypothetical protein